MNFNPTGARSTTTTTKENKPLELEYMLLHPDAVDPTRGHATDAGLDLAIVHDMTISVRQRYLAPTGVAVAIPPNCVGYINPRSGLGHKAGLSIVNAPGTIDPGYTGEIKVNLINLGDQPVTLRAGDRIAQLVLHPIYIPTLWRVSEFDAIGDRGSNGHGSTGLQLPGQLAIEDAGVDIG